MTTGSDEARPDQPQDEDAYALDPRTVEAILYAVEVEDRARLIELMEPLHAADIADLLEQISPFDRAGLIRLYDKEFDGDILSELDESVREEVIDVLKPDVLAEAVRDMALILGWIILHLLGVALKVSVDDEWHTVFLVFSPELYCKVLFLLWER